MDISIPTAFCSHLSDWQYTEGILTYKGRVYIPSDPSLQWAILICCHNHKTAGHPGYLKTSQLVPSEFWWPGLASFMCKYIKGCAVCQQNKSNTHPTYYDRYFFSTDLTLFLEVHLILSRHVIILPQGALSLYLFLSPLCYYSLLLISMLCMAMPSFLLFHSDASCITHVHASILCTAYLISASTAQGLGSSLCIQYQ